MSKFEDDHVPWNKGIKGMGMGPKHTEESKRKISEAHKGKNLSIEHRKKMSEAKKGCIPWNKGLTKSTDGRIKKGAEKGIGKKHSAETRKKISEVQKGKKLSPEQIKKMVESRKGYSPSEETRKKIGDANRGKIRSEEFRKKISEINKGRRTSKETKEKLSKVMIGRIGYNKDKKLSEEAKKKLSENSKGEKNHNWRGGITPKDKCLRVTIEFRLWREAVFARDNWMCQDCGKRGGRLHAHHIKPFAKFPELRTSIENGITLCIECHKRKHIRRANDNAELLRSG